jgi:predicted nucleic acid-binding protein
VIALDASVVAQWYVGKSPAPMARAALNEVLVNGSVAPGNYMVETLEALLRARRRGDIAQDELTIAIESLAALPVSLVVPGLSTIAKLAQAYSLSAQDAGYLAVAKVHAARLATLDKRLAKAAKTEGCLWTPPHPDEVEKKFSLLMAS